MKVKLYPILTRLVLLLAGLNFVLAGGNLIRSSNAGGDPYEEMRLKMIYAAKAFDVIYDAQPDPSTRATVAGQATGIINRLNWVHRSQSADEIVLALFEAEKAHARKEPWQRRAQTLKQLDDLLDGLRPSANAFETDQTSELLKKVRPKLLEVRKFVEGLQ